MIKKVYLSSSDLEDFETQWHPSEIEGFFVTKEELEQLQREAFASGRALISKRPYPHPLEYLHETFKDYLSSKSKEAK